MGFSIGGFLGTIAPAVLGSILGPVGSVIGRGIAGGLAGKPIGQPVGTVSARTERNGFVGSSFGPTTVALPGPTQAQLRLPIPRIPRSTVAPFITGTVVGTIGEILFRARENTGGPVSANKIRAAAKNCGLDIAASMFGLSVEDVCKVVIAKSSRRRRGISASDMRRTRSTIRKINNMRKSLKLLKSR